MKLRYSKKVMIPILTNISTRCYTYLKMQMPMLLFLKIWIGLMLIKFLNAFEK